MKQNHTLVFFISFLMSLCSCNNQSSVKNEGYERERNDSSISKDNDSIAKIKLPKNDSIACYLDSVIGKFHVKHFTQNDSTELCINPYINVGVGLDSIVHYDRKLNIYIGDGDCVIKKIITRDELLNHPEMKEFKQQGDYKRMCITYVTASLKNDSTLSYKITLEERDDWCITFNYEYCNKSFVYIDSESSSDSYDDD